MKLNETPVTLPQRRLGMFRVMVSPRGEYDVLRAAQLGCAVIRSEYLAYADAYEVYAEHPEFDLVGPGLRIPEYIVEMADALDGTIVRRRFKRAEA
jgi:hypothetical protein